MQHDRELRVEAASSILDLVGVVIVVGACEKATDPDDRHEGGR